MTSHETSSLLCSTTSKLNGKTHIIENVDNYQDTHPCVDLPEYLFFELPSLPDKRCKVGRVCTKVEMSGRSVHHRTGILKALLLLVHSETTCKTFSGWT